MKFLSKKLFQLFKIIFLKGWHKCDVCNKFVRKVHVFPIEPVEVGTLACGTCCNKLDKIEHRCEEEVKLRKELEEAI